MQEVAVEKIVEGRRLGKAPSRSNRKMLHFADFVKDKIELPMATHFWRRRTPFKLNAYGNIENGNCTRSKQAIATVRMERLETRRTPIIETDEVVKVYYEMTERLYGGGDTGASESDALDCWRREDQTFKDIKGHPCLIDAYTKINQSNQTELKKALWMAQSHGIAVCFNLPYAWSDGRTTWDIPPTQRLTGEWMPGSWGGHCLASDTIIHLLDGRNIPIGDLEGQKDLWVYGCLPNSRPVPVKASEVVRTKFTKTIQINIDNGSHIRLTPEHLVMLRDGSYKEAGKLVAGERLMPLRRQTHHRGYERLKWYDEGKMQGFTHRMFGQSFGCPSDKIVHHKDGNKKNNHPSNLGFITQEAHIQEHQPWIISPTYLMEGWSMKWPYCQGCGSTDKKHIGHGLSTSCYEKNKKITILDTIPSNENHKVLSIEEGKDEWVYDLMNVSPTQNFAANGIFVHNSCWATDYDEFGVTVPTWDIEVKISWAAMAYYCDESYLVIDKIDEWRKKKEVAKLIDLSLLRSEVNRVSSVQI